MARAIYIHIPFCIARCPYCNFTSYPGQEALYPAYVEAVCAEINRARPVAPISTIYLGGGTPTALSEEQLSAILRVVKERFEIINGRVRSNSPPPSWGRNKVGGNHPHPPSRATKPGFGGRSSPNPHPFRLGESAYGTTRGRELRASTFLQQAEAEITLEANPGTVDFQKLRRLRQAGFNRLSLGVQSLENELLQKIGRVHSAEQALVAYHAAREAGFGNISLDFIYALPGQTLEQWQGTLRQAIALAPEHISAYELTIEPGTPFSEMQAAGRLLINCNDHEAYLGWGRASAKPARGDPRNPAPTELNSAVYSSCGRLLVLPDEETRLEMYEAAIQILTAAGYEHYEVSNFALRGYPLPGRRSHHNQVYWRNESYYGFGAGAVRYLQGVRSNLHKSVERYIACVQQGLDPVESSEELTGRALMGETIMLALRTADGLDLEAFETRFGLSVTEVYGKTIASLQQKGLAEMTETRLRLTHRGLLLADRIALEFLEPLGQEYAWGAGS